MLGENFEQEVLAMKHYHIDLFEKSDRGLRFVNDNCAIYSKSTARHQFRQIVKELTAQVGKFKIHRQPHPEIPGAIKYAENHRLVVALSVCDCGGEG